MHLLDDVLPVHDQRAVLRHPQRHVQHRPVLADVDVLAGEHRVAAPLDVSLLRQLDQQLQRLVGDPVLGVVEEEAGALGDQALAAVGVLGEDLAQVAVADLGVVLLRAPSRPWRPADRASRRGSRTGSLFRRGAHFFLRFLFFFTHLPFFSFRPFLHFLAGGVTGGSTDGGGSSGRRRVGVRGHRDRELSLSVMEIRSETLNDHVRIGCPPGTRDGVHEKLPAGLEGRPGRQVRGAGARRGRHGIGLGSHWCRRPGSVRPGPSCCRSGRACGYWRS